MKRFQAYPTFKLAIARACIDVVGSSTGFSITWTWSCSGLDLNCG